MAQAQTPEVPVRVAVAANIYAKSFDGTNHDDAPFAYEVMDLREALTRVYLHDDAHCVAYVVEGATRQRRLRKSVLQHADFHDVVTMSVFIADVDLKNHPALDAKGFRERYERLFGEQPVLRHAGLYWTTHGCRIVQPLREALPVGPLAEAHLAAWHERLAAASVIYDEKCKDWPRHYRLPNVRRRVRGRWVDCRSEILGWDTMAPIDVPTLPAHLEARQPPEPSSPAASASLEPRAPVAWTARVPEGWERGIPLLAGAVGRFNDGRHDLYLALAGALVDREVSVEQVPILLRATAQSAGNDTKVDDRERCGRSTVDRIRLGDSYRGYGTLRLEYPDVADALDLALERVAEAKVPAPSIPSLEEAAQGIERAIEEAPDGVTIIAAECGAGKTHAAIRVARRRAAKPQTGARAPLNSKTVISVPTHALAVQIFDDLRADGEKVRRHFSPASLRDAEGEPVCKKHKVALPLVQGGQSQHYELCQGRGVDPCEHLDTCRAAQGWEGDEEARIVIGVHAHLLMLMREAGTTGLLVIDEPPPLPSSEKITLEDLDATERELTMFDGRFGAALKPPLSALWAWLRYASSPTPVDLRAALQAQRWGERDEDLTWARAATNETTDDLVELAKAATDDEHTRTGPPLKYEAIQLAKTSETNAHRIGRASRVLNTLHFALTTVGAVKLYTEGVQRESPPSVVAHVYEPLQRALAREGRTIVLDANAETNQPLYTKALGYQPMLHQFPAADAAPISRTLLRSSKATRTGWKVLSDRFDVTSGSFQRALEAVIDWALEDGQASSLAIITMKPIRQILEDCLLPESDELEASYQGRRRLLKAARDRLAPILRRWRGEIVWGHYGAVRGLNHMKHVDLLVTLGDPRPNITATQNDLALLGLPEEASAQRVDALARAELEQAQGRLRAPRRTRGARVLHVGTLKPGGTGWSGEVEVRVLQGGRPRTTNSMHLVKLHAMVHQLGGVSRTARLLHVSRSTLNNYVGGRSAAPPEITDKLRAVWRQAQEG